MSKCAECETILGVYEYNNIDSRVICDNCFKNSQEQSCPEKRDSGISKLTAVLGIWIIYRLLFLIPSITSEEVTAYWESMRWGDTIIHELYFSIITKRNTSIMALGGTPYYLAILYFFFFSKFIPPLQRMIQDKTKRIRVRNCIIGTALFFVGIQSYLITAMNLTPGDIPLITSTLQIILISLGSVAAIALFITVTRIVGFPGVMIFLLLDLILVRSIHFLATYKMIAMNTPDLPPLKIVHLFIAGVSLWMWHSDYRETWGRFAKTL